MTQSGKQLLKMTSNIRSITLPSPLQHTTATQNMLPTLVQMFIILAHGQTGLNMVSPSPPAVISDYIAHNTPLSP